ncbi:MAG: T9SS type A sorting domain-containing protein [Lewinellaceae bacterium]|nr:T9SS type A sorting domain-containing protein [Lewinellaceae bacterium]
MKYVYILSLCMLGIMGYAQDTIPRYRDIFIRSGMLTDTTICTQDGKPDIILFQPPTYAFQTSLLITDTNDVVQAVKISNTYNFEGTGAGINRVYGIIYIGLLNVKPGTPLDSIEVNSYLIGITNNYVTVNKVVAVGGTVSDAYGQTDVTLCLGDDYPDQVVVSNQGDKQYQYAYLVTDEDGKIIMTSQTDTISFENAMPGTCLIHGISFTGAFQVDTGTYLADLSFGDRCFDLSSNYITVNRIPYSDVELPSVQSDTSSYLVCSGDLLPDTVHVSASSGGFPNVMFVVTDTNDVLLDYNPDGIFDFEGGTPGEARIRAVGYFGLWTGELGQALSTGQWASACFGVSEDQIFVHKENVAPSVIASNLGEELSFCAGDGSPDWILLSNTSGITGSYVYLVTDTTGVIHQMIAQDSFDLESILGGESGRIYGLSFSGNLLIVPDSTSIQDALADGCTILSENYLTINQVVVDGGSINGSGQLICLTPENQQQSWIVQTTSSSNSDYWFVLTDTSRVIVMANTTGNFTFNADLAGSYLIYGVATASALTFMPGDTFDRMTIPGCSSASSNELNLKVSAFDAGSITNTGGDGIVLCTGDDIPDTVSVQVNGQGAGGEYSFIVTATNKVIQAVSDDLLIDWDQIPGGTSQIWGIHYDGELPFAIGDTLVQGACYALTASPVNIQKVQVVSLKITSDGGDSLYFCANAINLDSIHFTTTALTSLKKAWFLVDSAQVIIQLTDQDRFDFDTSGNVQLAVYGATYTGNLVIQAGDTLTESPVSDACFALSSNAIPIFAGDPGLVDGGSIASDLGDTINVCVSDGVEDFVTLSHQSGAASLYSYVITDENGKILVITGDNLINFEGAGAGSGYIYGLSHANPLPGLLGENILEPLAIGCYDLSQNKLTLKRTSVEPFSISAESGDTIKTCISPDSKDTLDITFTSSGADKALILASLDGIVLDYVLGDRLPLADVSVSSAMIWGLSYGGNLNIHIGDTLSQTSLSDLCYARSENFLVLNGTYVSGDSIFVPSHLDTTDYCVGNGIVDSLRLFTTSKGDHYVYVLLRNNQRIEHVIKGSYYNLDPLESGTLTVLGLSYAGDLLIDDGDIWSDSLEISTGCYSVSLNQLTLNLNELLPGTLTSNRSQESFAVCIGDGNPDLVTFSIVDGENEKEAYLITDAQDEVIFVSTEPVIDLDVLPLGFYMVYGISYNGELYNLVGQQAFRVPLSDGCFALTDNGIEIIADMPEGGMVRALGGDTMYTFCVSDGVADRLFLSNESNSLAPYQFVVTDTDNVVLELPNIPGVDFEGSGAGVVRIWGISYTGDLLLRLGDTITSVMVSADCYSVSDNYLTIVKQAGPDCGSPLIANPSLGLQLAPNPVVNRIRLTIESPSGSNFTGKVGTLIVYNTMQTEIFRKVLQLSTENFSTDVDVSNLKSGLYILQFNIGTYSKSAKFIKQ